LPQTFVRHVCVVIDCAKYLTPHYLAELFSSALKPESESLASFRHISWRHIHDGNTRAKRAKKDTPRYAAVLFAPIVLCLHRLRRDLRHLIWLESAENHVKLQSPQVLRLGSSKIW